MSQDEYIAILFDDCGFDAAPRRAWLRAEFVCAYPDELRPSAKHAVIERLKSLKAAQCESAALRAREEEQSGLLEFE